MALFRLLWHLTVGLIRIKGWRSLREIIIWVPSVLVRVLLITHRNQLLKIIFNTFGNKLPIYSGTFSLQRSVKTMGLIATDIPLSKPLGWTTSRWFKKPKGICCRMIPLPLNDSAS